MPIHDRVGRVSHNIDHGIRRARGTAQNVRLVRAREKNSAVFRGFCGFRGKNRSGVSLLEAVVAIAIVGLTSISALEAVGGNMRTTERARRAIEAEALSGTRLDFMDLMSDRELQALPDSVEKGKFLAPLDEYSWKTTSTPVGEQGGVYDIRVTIDWPTGSYLVKSYQYRTPPLVTR